MHVLATECINIIVSFNNLGIDSNKHSILIPNEYFSKLLKYFKHIIKTLYMTNVFKGVVVLKVSNSFVKIC